MSTFPSHDYDRIAYPTMAHPQTFCGHLAIKGYLRGLDVAPPDRCRVLELGCGDGFNLAAMAALHPESSYTGIDYSAGAIARGRGMLQDLGLTQVRLETADICALSDLEPQLGNFDYVVAHGVYSWVSAEVRDALLATIGRVLAPQGVAFVSYLVLPGAYQREAVRSIIRFHTRQESDPHERIRQARAILRMVADGSREPNHYTHGIAAELELIEQRPDETLFHDELSAESAPFLFTEFIAHAARHGMQFIAEADYLAPVARSLSEAAREQLRPFEQNRVLLEQYLDLIEGRRFRQTLLGRPTGDGRLRADRLDSLWVSFPAAPAASPEALNDNTPLTFHGQKSARLRANKPQEKAVLLTLIEQRAGAMRFPALLAATRARLEGKGIAPGDDFEAALRLYLCRAFLPGLVEVSWTDHPYLLNVPARPKAHPLARWLLQRHAPSVLSYSGRFVKVEDPLGRHLLSLLDGRRDHAELLGEIRSFLAAAHAAPRSAGEQEKLPTPDDPRLEEELQRSLSRLADLGLFARDSE